MIAVARVIEDLALLLAVGILLLGWLSRREPALRWVRIPLVSALGVACVGGFLVVTGEALAAASSASLGAVTSYLTTGLPGVARLARPVMELVAVIAAALWRRWTWVPLGLALVVLAAAGHAAAIRPSWWGIAVETDHLLSTGIWAGGILGLALQHPPGSWRGEDGRRLLGRFTPVALGAFSISALTGVLRAIQELGGFGAFLGSAYGIALLVKVCLVGVMVLLSIFAWRRHLARPRIEAGVAIAVVVAAALLSAFPLPPARINHSDATQEAAVYADSALPRPGDLTLGGDAGSFLVGLTYRASDREILIFLSSPEGDSASAARRVVVSLNGRALKVSQCAPTCRSAERRGSCRGPHRRFDRWRRRRDGSVRDARSGCPWGRGSANPSARDDESASQPPPGRNAHGRWTHRLPKAPTFVAPDRLQVHARGVTGGSDMFWIGGTRYLRELPGSTWQVTSGGGAPSIPTFIWDSFSPFIDVRSIGQQTVDGVRTDVLLFFGGDASLPVWFRLWVDPNGLVRKADMRTEGHFMDDRFYDFDAPIAIRPPTGANAADVGGTGG